MRYVSYIFVLVMLLAKSSFALDMEVKRILRTCAPSVHEQTMASIINTESGGYVYAVADAGPVKLPWRIRKSLVRSFFPSNREEAVQLAESLIAAGHTVSLGPAQLNDRNLSKYGMTVNDAFDLCKNLSATSQLLAEYYSQAALEYGPGKTALIAAISAFNSGSFTRGLNEGYVRSVFQQSNNELTFKYSSKPASKTSKFSSKFPKYKKIVKVNQFSITVKPYKVATND